MYETQTYKLKKQEGNKLIVVEIGCLREPTVQAKNYQIHFFLLFMKYQHVMDVVVAFYSNTTCVKGVKGG